MTNSCKNAVLNLAEKEACVLFFLVIKRIILQAILGSKQSPHFNQNTFKSHLYFVKVTETLLLFCQILQ